MDLDRVRSELVLEIRDKLRYVADMRSAASLADLFDEIGAELEGLAICHWVEEADVFEYRQNLARAGHARRFFLRRSAAEGNGADRHLALSRNRGFLDACAAGSLGLARDIARLSQAPFDPSWEYEDDHDFYLALHRIVLAPEPFPAATVSAIATRFEQVLEGAASPRLDAIRAIALRDAAALEKALGALVLSEAARNDAALTSARVLEHDVLYWATRRISIEALALLKIGELVGVVVAGELPLCPRLARARWKDDAFEDLFEAIERLP